MLTDLLLGLINAPALFRVGAFFLVWIGLWLPIAVPLAIALKWRPPQPISPTQKLPLLASLYVLVPLLMWGVTALRGVAIADYGFPVQLALLPPISIGWLAGAVGLALMFAIEVGLGWVRWSPPTVPRYGLTVLLPTALIGLWVSVTEEVVFRGFLQTELQSDYGWLGAGAIASLIFAVLHLVWEGKDNIPQLPGLWLMGMVLVLARWVNQDQLGLAIGLHAGWIWAIASLDTLQTLTYTNKAPSWVTGLDHKPLAGLMGLLFLLATGLALYAVQGAGHFAA
ncbi:MAG TPA: CPBP family intramembrane glutamic endopeptidase [Chroococcidiopsis sp.]